MIEQALRQRLLSRQSVKDLVGERIQQGLAVQGEPRPFVGFDVLGGETHHHTQGTSWLTTSRIEIHCGADTYVQARQLYDAVRDAVDGFGGGLWGDVLIDSAFLDPPADNNRDRPQHGRERPLLVLSATLTVNWLQDVPAHQTESSNG